MKELLKVCEERENMAPLLFDAKKPEEYRENITKVDVIYQDLAQRDQVEILIKNAKLFLKKGGVFILIIKARSIDVVKSSSKILEDVKKKLKGFTVLNVTDISNTHKGHCVIIGKNQ
jgi:fibrillarin-like pre-rRNA processing protein